MWSDPYLETCCRSALHRLALAGAAGRPSGGTDAPRLDQPRLDQPCLDRPCLERLAGKGLAQVGPDGRFRATAAGLARHRSEILGGGQGAG